MRTTLLFLACLALAGCAGSPDEASNDTPVTGPAGADTTGCIGDGVGAGNGDITSDRVCPDANETLENATV